VSRRTLADTVSELVAAVAGSGLVAGPLVALTVRDLTLDVPVEVALTEVDGEPALLANAARWRWTTVFDQQPSRLRIRYVSAPAAVSDVLGWVS
jgi:hypothetical protein